MSNKKIDIEEQIIKKSFNLFLVNGYEKTTIRQIADSVGMKRSFILLLQKERRHITFYL